MKHFLLPPLIIIGIMLLGGCSDKIKYHDEDTIIDMSVLSTSIYKTKKDYYDNIFVKIDSVGNIKYYEKLKEDHSYVKKDSKGKWVPGRRWKLRSGYVVDYAYCIDNVVTNISYNEYMEHAQEHGDNFDANDLFKIIDKNPFTDYYFMHGDRIGSITLKELNDMIEDGSIEDYFQKLEIE